MFLPLLSEFLESTFRMIVAMDVHCKTLHYHTDRLQTEASFSSCTASTVHSKAGCGARSCAHQVHQVCHGGGVVGILGCPS